MVKHSLDGDYKSAREINFRLLPLIHAIFIETNPIPVKKALNIMGFIGDEIRLPLSEVSEINAEKINEALKNYGILK